MRREAFDLVRDSVPAEAAAVQYGLKVSRHMARCPFHDDHRPSMSFYGGRFQCFSCGQNGSSIDLAAQLLGITPAEAVKQMAHDFGLSIDEKPSAESRRRYIQLQREKETYRSYELWRSRTLGMLTTCYRMAHQAVLHGCPEGTEKAIIWQPVIEHWMEELECEDVDRQIQVFRMRREVNHRCRTILETTKRRSGAV